MEVEPTENMEMDVEVPAVQERAWWTWFLGIFRWKSRSPLSSISAIENTDTSQLSPNSMEEQ
jgi:hypothetical protein